MKTTGKKQGLPGRNILLRSGRNISCQECRLQSSATDTAWILFPSEEGDIIDGIVFRVKLKDKTGRFEKTTGETFYAS